LGYPSGEIYSVSVPVGYELTMYTTGFEGEMQRFTGDVDWLDY